MSDKHIMSVVVNIVLTSVSIFIVCMVYDQIDEQQHKTARGVMI